MCSPAPSYCPDNATACTSDADCGGAACRRRSLYVGTKQSFNSCDRADDNASVDCCDKPTVNGAYRVKKRIATGAEHGKDNRTNAILPCNDDSPTKDSHCAHLTRILRDQARNFIVRNANRQPYFLTVATHDVHDPENAPVRTENHYLTAAEGGTESLRPSAPLTGSMHWASMEEVDSLVGQLLTLLDQTGVCENDPRVACSTDAACAGKCIGIGRCSDGDEAKACLADSDCEGRGHCEPQSMHTLVMFFGDQGSPKAGGAYGDPDLRGGKGDVQEGGVRVGLLARGPWSGGTTDAIASAVDVFATAAEAAGYELPNGRVDHVTSRYCSNTNAICRDDSDCGTGVCRPLADSKVAVDSKSFLPLLADPTATDTARDLAYASFPSAGVAVITRDDYLLDQGNAVASAGKGVCAYENTSPGPVRSLHGASCETCDPDPCAPGDTACDASDPAHPDYCRSKRCKVPGNVCVSMDTGAPAFVQACNVADGKTLPGSKDYCARFEPIPIPTSSAETYRALYRCRTSSDCPRTDRVLECLPNVWTMCDRCVGAAWKLKANPNPSKTLLTGLFDLKSNPEEEERLNFRFQNCDDSKPDVIDSSVDLDANGIRVRNVIQTLKTDDGAAIRALDRMCELGLRDALLSRVRVAQFECATRAGQLGRQALPNRRTSRASRAFNPCDASDRA
jgi:hypothetical protein